MTGAVVRQFMTIHAAVTVTAKDQRKLTATGSALASAEKFLKPVEASTLWSAGVPSVSFTDAYHLTSDGGHENRSQKTPTKLNQGGEERGFL